MNSVPRPPTVKLSVDRVFPLKSNGEREEVPNLTLIKDYLMELGFFSKDLMMELISKAKRIFNQEPNLMRVNGPSHIFGDIHG